MPVPVTADDDAAEAAMPARCEQVSFPADWVQKCESWGSDLTQVHENGKD